LYVVDQNRIWAFGLVHGLVLVFICGLVGKRQEKRGLRGVKGIEDGVLGKTTLSFSFNPEQSRAGEGRLVVRTMCGLRTGGWSLPGVMSD
jgi:hypothetical protein